MNGTSSEPRRFAWMRALLIVVALYALAIGAVLLTMSLKSECALDSISMSMAGGLVTIVGVYATAETVRLGEHQ